MGILIVGIVLFSSSHSSSLYGIGVGGGVPGKKCVVVCASDEAAILNSCVQREQKPLPG